jgi:hypothetical protein
MGPPISFVYKRIDLISLQPLELSKPPSGVMRRLETIGAKKHVRRLCP